MSDWIDDILNKNKDADDIIEYVKQEVKPQLQSVIKNSKEMGFTKEECYDIIYNIWLLMDMTFKENLLEVLNEEY